jgi:hypothetical protein
LVEIITGKQSIIFLSANQRRHIISNRSLQY